MSHQPLIVAHRGASHDAPENTLAAFRLAFKQKADAIEGDFRLTADGKVVCIHNATTAERGDRNLNVANSTLAQLRTVDLGVKVGKQPSSDFPNERIATLAEVLAVVPRGKRVFIELKIGPEIVPAVKKIIEAGPVPLSKISIIAFNADTVAACRAAMPKVVANWLVYYKKDSAGRRTPTPDTILKTIENCRASGLGTESIAGAMPMSFVRRVRAAGYGLHVWTVDTAMKADAFTARGFDSITTNKPAWLRAHLLGSGVAPIRLACEQTPMRS